MLDLAKDLNQQQLEAAAHVEGPLLVIAGAGSGKTRVITYRIANLVHGHGVSPHRIMAVTFTNKAAREMQERVSLLLGHGARCWVSTFHSSCAKLLRTYGETAGVNPNFTIYDDQDQKAMVARAIKELAFSDKQFPPRAVQNEINRAKRELIGPGEYPGSDFYRERIQRIYELYEKRMRDAGALDFGDLLYRTVKAMQDKKELAKEISGLFDFVMVDEFQDTNRVQLELVRLLTPHRNICVVGDDDQSIYSWRGADVTNILDFEKLFPGASVVTLDRNYRSTGNILQAAHGVVSKLQGRRPKELWTDNAEGDQISVVHATDEREEARLVADQVRAMAKEDHPLSEQAIFYRTNAQSRVFEEVLRSLNIPHRVLGGMRFYERAEVKDLISYLRLVQNAADHTAFTRIINTPTRGIGKTTVDKLVALAAGKGVSAYDAIDHAHEAGVNAGGVKKLTAFKAMVESWRAEADQGPAHLAHRILDDTEYLSRLEQENSAEADARIENLRELAGSIEDFEADAENPSLDTFLELVALQTDVDAANFDEDQVTLMTVHSAKGLEFDVVYVTGMEEGLFPFKKSEENLIDGGIEAMEEERRLGYVAMTRARKRLFLTRALVRRLFGSSRSTQPSRFLHDVPGGIVDDISPERPKVSLVEPSFGSGGVGRMGKTQLPKFDRPAKPPGKGSDEVWVDTSFDQSTDESSLRPGAKVRHPRFGQGEILAVLPGAKPKVQVAFPAFGTKTILLDYLEMA